MGLTQLALEVGNPATPQETTRLESLVDSGAIYSVVPRAVLEGYGIAPLAEQQFRLADGSSVVRQRGYALGLDPLRRELIPLPMVL